MSSRNFEKLFYRMPIAFGPFPGPRQTWQGLRRNGSSSTSTEAVVTVKVAREKVTKLLPTEFQFQQSQSPDEKDVAYVSISAKSLHGLEWLGNRGYNLLSVYIHGVEYKAPCGELYRGTFLPVLWENLADPIISGREELGYPKLFGDLNIQQTSATYKMELSWQDFKCAELKLSGLHDRPVQDFQGLAPTNAGVDDGLLLFKHIPQTGKPGSFDAQYPVWVSHKRERELQSSTITRLMWADEGDVKWIPGDWNNLPTLHHIIATLHSLQPIAVVRGLLVEKKGLSDLSSASKI